MPHRGPEASALTKRLLPVGRRIVVRSDPPQDARDHYGRFLGCVFTAGKALTRISR